MKTLHFTLERRLGGGHVLMASKGHNHLWRDAIVRQLADGLYITRMPTLPRRSWARADCDKVPWPRTHTLAAKPKFAEGRFPVAFRVLKSGPAVMNAEVDPIFYANAPYSPAPTADA